MDANGEPVNSPIFSQRTGWYLVELMFSGIFFVWGSIFLGDCCLGLSQVIRGKFFGSSDALSSHHCRSCLRSGAGSPATSIRQSVEEEDFPATKNLEKRRIAPH